MSRPHVADLPPPPAAGVQGGDGKGGASLFRWLDSWVVDPRDEAADPHEIDWVRVVPFLAIHVAGVAALFTTWSPFVVLFAVGFYAVRMFAITAFYHRYFSHRTFQASRPVQFLFALLGATAVQRGPLWWAAHHREHHRHSDAEGDIHSPVVESFWWSHVGWILARRNFRTKTELVPDLMRFPELRFLDRYDSLVPLLMIPGLYGLGAALEAWAPGLGTSGLHLVLWGCLSTVVLYHVTFCINSMAHRLGSRPYETKDRSRNNLILALLTFGEGWHNNHHRYPASARQGFLWWELDLSYATLRVMQGLGLVSGLRPVPARILDERRGA